ncbi:MAG: hypothetical protein ACM3NR_00690 [Methanosarcina sp.]
MKITDYGYREMKMINPINNEVIVDSLNCNLEANSLKGIWYLDNFENPEIKDIRLIHGWKMKHFIH